jgi:hypothetical protein
MNRKVDPAVARRRSSPKRVSVTVRLPEHVIERIDQELGGRDIPLSRNNWILEATLEKLRRNGEGAVDGKK